MNPTPSESFGAQILMEFEDDASAFANAEPEFVSIPAPSDVPATTTLERLKGQLVALTPKERAELAYFLIYTLDEQEQGAEASADPIMRLETVRQTLAQVVGAERQEP